MKLTITLSKRATYTLIALIILILLGFGVYSFSLEAPNPGHPLSELQACQDGESIVSVADTWECAFISDTHARVFRIGGWDMNTEQRKNIPHNIPDFTKIASITGVVFIDGETNSYPLGTLADSKLYHQAGNSVIVPIIQRIAENMKKVLINDKPN